MILNLFLLNILLLNFMVAILSSTYSEMLESGSFMYKCSLYEYCERFLIAFKNKSHGELVVHSPPINAFVVVLIPFSPFKDLMEHMSELFSQFNFWMENLIFLAIFGLFEILLSPMVFIVSYFNIIYSTGGPFSTVYNLFKWTAFGPVYLTYILLKDLWNMIYILSMLDGCKDYLERQKDKREKADDNPEEMPPQQ